MYSTQNMIRRRLDTRRPRRPISDLSSAVQQPEFVLQAILQKCFLHHGFKNISSTLALSCYSNSIEL